MRASEALRYNDDYPIDIVLTWVDGADHAWRELKASYSGGTKTQETSGLRTAVDDTDERYRDWETLRYLFRGIEKCMPWVRTVHFVTCGQKPEWLNTSHPKLHMVNHTDYIPSQYLPTFNAGTIEMNFHRIDGLSEHFIYFNDDTFAMSPLDRHDFFIGGYPVDMLALQPVVANHDNEVMSHIYLNNTLTIARHFRKYETMKTLRRDYFNIHYPIKNYVYNHLEMAFPLFTGFYSTHAPAPLCVSAYKEIWEKEFDTLDATCRHKFRDSGDVTQYLIREWQKQSGNFVSANVEKLFKYYNISDDCEPIVQAIKTTKRKMICINDANTPVNFEKLKQDLISAFQSRFPEKSEYELPTP
jgi:hypothetical protein